MIAKIPVFGKSPVKIKMPVNMAQYNQAYDVKMKLALTIATELIGIVDANKCSKKCVTSAKIKMKMKKEKHQMICDMIGAILFSSGYNSYFKLIKEGVKFEIFEMSEEQRIDAMEGVTLNETSEEENPCNLQDS